MLRSSFLLPITLVCFLFCTAPSADPASVQVFHKELSAAMRTPQDLSKIRKDFLAGIGGFTENPDSFVAFTKLHEAIEKYLASPLSRMAPNFPELAADFKDGFERFLKKLPLLGTLSDEGAYKDHLGAFYHEFLAGWIHKHGRHFWDKTLADLTSGDGLQELDMMERAFFSLMPWFPGYEGRASPKYQFYPLYAFNAPNGTVVLIRIDPIWGGLSLYVKSKDTDLFCSVSVPSVNFDISSSFRCGGGGDISSDLKSLLKVEGSHLIFSGYDYQVFRQVDYDAATNTFTLTSTPYHQEGNDPPAPSEEPTVQTTKGVYACPFPNNMVSYQDGT